MRTIFSLVLWLLCPVFLTGQDEVPEPIPFSIEEVVTFGDTGFVVVAFDDVERPKKMRLQFFDMAENLLANQTYSLERRDLGVQIEGIFAWNGRLSVLSSLYYPGPKRNHLIFTQYDVPSLERASTELIDEAFTPGLYRVPFGYSISPDSSRIAFYGWSYSLPEDPPRISVRVLDLNLETVWEQRYLLPYRNEAFYVYGCILDEDGRVYLTCENYTGTLGRYARINENRIQRLIYYLLPGQANPKPFLIDNGKNNIADVKFRLDEKRGGIVGAGFYRRGNRTTYEGIFTVRFNGISGKSSQHLIPIDKDIYQRAYGYREEEAGLNPNRYPFAEYFLSDFFLQEDGSLKLVAEQVIERASAFPPILYNDIMVIRMSDPSQIDWIMRIPKRQEGFWEDDPFFSYSLIRENSELVFFFNDDPDNHLKPRPRRLNTYTPDEKTALVLARLSDEGLLYTENIREKLPLEEGFRLLPRLFWKLETARAICYGEKTAGGASIGKLFTFEW
ncbi:MAG: hypothetical protein R3350_00465 [Saprospiraceae bacterium]|nr:hypothetical protein [Saprospiraceae bacterium]